MKNKFDYISILAGGACKFNCDFCVGKDMRKNITPHFSKKVESFIECFSDMTNLVSVSGDTSDPSFVEDTMYIPGKVREINPDARVTIHTRNIDFIEDAFHAGYDKFVFSIDEDFTLEMLEMLRPYKDKVRLSFVMTSYNHWIIDEWSKNMKEIFDFQMTLRPEVNAVKDETTAWMFYDTFLNIRARKYRSPYNSKKFVTQMKNGAFKLKQFPNIWYWDYNKTNPNIEARYLFSNDEIGSNCKWGEI